MPAKRKLGWVLITLAVLLGVIQFVPIDRTNPPKLYADPLELNSRLHDVLKASCYDCHSNVTSWPWYSRIAPLSWLIARDVHEGRGRLNFTTWHLYSGKEWAELREEIMETVEEGAMPPPRYILLYPEAELTPEEIAEIKAWTTLRHETFNKQRRK